MSLQQRLRDAGLSTNESRILAHSSTDVARDRISQWFAGEGPPGFELSVSESQSALAIINSAASSDPSPDSSGSTNGGSGSSTSDSSSPNNSGGSSSQFSGAVRTAIQSGTISVSEAQSIARGDASLSDFVSSPIDESSTDPTERADPVQPEPGVVTDADTAPYDPGPDGDPNELLGASLPVLSEAAGTIGLLLLAVVGYLAVSGGDD